jgi:hypothetical protein
LNRRQVLRLMTAIAPQCGWYSAPVSDLGSWGLFWAANYRSQRPSFPHLTYEEAQLLALDVARCAKAGAPDLHVIVCVEADDGRWAVVDPYTAELSNKTTRPNFPKFFPA